MFQNPFNRAVRTRSATLDPFAQNSIDLFRREKPEGVVARRTGPTICHETKHLVEFARRTGRFGECSNPCQPRMFSEACFPRRHSAGIGSKVLMGRIPAVSGTDRSSSLLGNAASAEGSDSAAKIRGSGEIAFLWSEHRPARDKTLEKPEELRTYYARIIHDRSSNGRAIWQVLRPTRCASA